MLPSYSLAGNCAPCEDNLEGSQIEEEWMNPSIINYSQDTISKVFTRKLLASRKADDSSSLSGGTYSEALKATPIITLSATLQQLKDGSLTVEEIPRIRVCKHDGDWYTLDNRRLWVFKQFDKPIPVLIQEPCKEFFQKLTREIVGESVCFLDSDDKRAESKENETFLGVVLQWSVENIMNEKMFVNKVQPIALRFPNLKAYYKAFRYPLLENTRGEIEQGLEAIGLAPYISLRSVEELKSPKSPNADKKSQLRKLKLTTIGLRNVVQRTSSNTPWKPKPTDLVILSTVVPEDLEDLRRSGEFYTLAEIHRSPDETDTSDDNLFFQVLAYLPEECPEYKEVLEGKRNWYAVFLCNLATGMRIWDAINPEPIVFEFENVKLCDGVNLDSVSSQHVDHLSLKHRRQLVEETLYSEDAQVITISDGEHEVDQGLESLVEKYCNFRQLNESQTEAVRCTVMGLLREEGFRVRLVQGPPGTGKTSTLAALVSIVSCLKERILVCAPTNRAVSEVALRYLQHLQSSLQDTSQFSDFTTPTSIGMRFCRPLQLGDVVMVGNEERLDTDTIVSSIFLAHRKRRLLEALAPNTGWRNTAQKVVSFLRDAENEYELYVELWKEKEKTKEKNKENKEEETPLLDFLQFMRKQLHLLGPDMIRNGQIMCSDLSSKRLSDDSRRSIKDSCVVMGLLMKALGDECLTDAEVRDCCTGSNTSHNVDHGELCPSFCSAREELLELMSSRPGYFVKGCGSVPAPEIIEDICVRDASLVFSTTSSSGRWCVRMSGGFQYAVIDEAAQLVEAETAIVTQLPGIERALLVGDPQQLQALVTSQIAKDCGYGRSLFERLQTLGHPCHILNVQYRMHPAISQFPNRQFYDGAINDGPNVLAEKFKKAYQEFYGPYAFIDVKDGLEERDEKTKSWKNPVEAEVVHHLINKIRAVAVEQSESLHLGVIAPYKCQVELMTKRQYSGNTIVPSGASFQVDVKTVDGFQGGEKDVILFSAVRANSGGHIGFNDDARRLNVALTRGRYCVWIIGNARTLAAHNEMWRALVEDAKKRDCYLDAGNDQGMKKTILRVKKELEQYASLLHHDSILFKDTIWKIMFSKEFKETITNIKSTQSRQTILNTILNLANGRRSPYPTKCNCAAELYMKMIHVQPTAGLTLVWTIDVEKSDPVKQVIRIWNAVESSFIPGLIRRLEAGFSTYTGPYIDRCSTVSFLNKIRKVVVPAVWKREKSFIWHEASGVVRKKAGVALQENDSHQLESRLEKATVDESILLMKFYSLTSGIARQLLTAANGSKIELLFEVNEEEASIIQYPFSTFILGRSGTGKTTVITTRLLKLEQQFRLAVNGFTNKSVEEVGLTVRGVGTSQASKVGFQPLDKESLRQVIITLSPKLCAAIRHHIAKTSRTMLAEDSAPIQDNNDEEEDVMLDEEEEMKLMGGIPDTLVNISPNSYPLVITFRKFLAMVDGSVTCPFFVQESSSLTDERARLEGSESSSSSDAEEAEYECDSPSVLDEEEDTEVLKFNDKDKDEDSDYSSLDEDVATEEDDTTAKSHRRNHSESSGNLKKRMTEVTFEHFISFYWPHFNQDFIKQFDSSVVFTEIISFIKGSLEALHTDDGRLSRHQYLSMAVRRTSIFDERQRDSIYRIFMQYERYKAVRKEYDIADYCTHLYRQMRLGNYVGLKFHYVYVDEVQDLTMMQIALFKYVCSNIEEGYVFAGDTAQTIASGVSFRFQDIRHLFYTEFLGKGDSSLGKGHRTGRRALEDKDNEKVYEDSKLGKAPVEKTPHMPDLHHLSHNFRTHAGIVNIANSIVQLLYHFFPNTVDKLNPEFSLIQGENPIFLEREEKHESVTSLFGHGGAAGGGGCDFGAEQVILVRDMATKHHVTENLGKRGLVMSVLECKGLEFQDVLLYNFFSDSLFGSKWRVLYSYMAENSTWEDQSGRKMSFPQFDVQKHNLLMSELKQLYVVVTRARQRLWIYDECVEHHKPMLDYWNHAGLIQVKRLDEDLTRTIHGRSTPEEWKRRGIQMFNDHHYDMAQLSFERAGDLHHANWAKAAGLQQAGERLLGSDTKASAQLLRDAATLYLSLGKGEAAAKCYLKNGESKKAGMIFRDSFQPPRLKDAGDCFMDSKCWREAAEAYGKCLCFRQSLHACLKGKLLDVGLDILGDWEQHLNSRNPEGGNDLTTNDIDDDEFKRQKFEYLKKCAHHYHKQRNSELMMKFIRLFPSVASQKVFLKRRDYFDQLMEVEEGEGNFVRAAEMAEQKGDLKHSVMLMVRGGCHEQAVEKLLDRARFDMLWSGGKPGWPLISTAESQDLLQRASCIISSCPNRIRRDLLQELQLLLVPSNGLENWKQVEDSDNIRFQLIAGRQAIDDILLESTAATNASLTALVPDLLIVWDLWSQKLISLIQAIIRAQRRRDTVEDEVFLESSNTFLGAAKHTQPHLFFVTDVASSWLKNSPTIRLPNQGQRGQVSSAQLFSLSESFWARQLWHAGVGIMKVMEVVLCLNSSDPSNAFPDAARFATECFQPRGEQLCRLYSIAKTLADIMSKNTIQDEYLDLRSRLQRYGRIIYDASFPHYCNKDSWRNVLTFRLEVGAVYDSIATSFMEEFLEHKLPVFQCKSVGRIQMLLPLLSRQWIRKYGTEIQDRLRQEDWSKMWEGSHRMYDKFSEDSGSSKNACTNWVDAVEIYCGSVQTVYKKFRESLGPFEFMQLLERGIVVDLACLTNLHSLILPQSLVVNHMTGDRNTNLFSAVLNMHCNCNGCNFKGECFRFTTLRFVSRLILDMLYSSSYQIETWFDMVKIDWRVSLHSLVFRMLVSVLTVCINLRLTVKSNDRPIWDNAIKTLRAVFMSGSPLLRGQPPAFDAELRKIFCSQYLPQDGQVRLTFMKAMNAVKDPLVVLKARYGKITDWAYKQKLTLTFVSHKSEMGRVFRTTFLSNKKPTCAAKPKPVTNADIQSIDLQKQESGAQNASVTAGQIIDGNARGTVAPLQNSGEQSASIITGQNTDRDALESTVNLLGTNAHVTQSNAVDGQEELAADEEDQPQDVWDDDESTDDLTHASRTIRQGHVSIGEGQTVASFIKSRLLQLLEDARQRLKEDLSATEKNRRDARTTFRKLSIQKKEYLEFFLAEACPLKATADEWLQELETAVQVLKDDDRFDEIADSQDDLQKAVVILDPRTEEHVAQDLKLLQEKLGEVRHLLENGKQQFEKQIRNLGTSQEAQYRDGKVSSNTAECEVNTSANQEQAVKSQKRKPQQKKKKKKGKK